MNIRLMKFISFVFVLFIAHTNASESRATIIGPYTPDANTLHLWHFDEEAAPHADSGSGNIPLPQVINGATSGVASFAGFGKAVSTLDTTASGTLGNAGVFAKTPANGTGDDTSMATFQNSTTGAFTYEAIIRTGNLGLLASGTKYDMYLMSMDVDNSSGGAGSPRGWVFELEKPAGGNNFRLDFASVGSFAAGQYVLSQNLTIASNTWYHVAVSYDGNAATAGNTKFYWTEMTQTATEASQIGLAAIAGTHLGHIVDISATAGDFVIGNEGLGVSGGGSSGPGNFPGLIDEVRISDVVRGSTEFIFIPEPSSYLFASLGVIGFGMVYKRRRS